MSSFLNFPVEASVDPMDTYDWSNCMSNSIMTKVNLPLAILGIVLNLVVLWVWAVDKQYRPSSYFFKAFAVTQTFVRLLYVTLLLVNNVTRPSVMTKETLIRAMWAYHSCSIYIIMMIALVRFLAIYASPAKQERFLARSVVRLALALIVALCFSMELPFKMTLDKCFSPSQEGRFLVWFLTMMIPAVIQIVLMTMVVWKLNRPVWTAGLATVHPHSTSSAESRLSRTKARSVAVTVACFCLTIVLLYPGAAFFAFYVYIHHQEHYHLAQTLIDTFTLLIGSLFVGFYIVRTGLFFALWRRRIFRTFSVAASAVQVSDSGSFSRKRLTE